VHELISLFLGGVPVPGPVNQEGEDATPDTLICQ